MQGARFVYAVTMTEPPASGRGTRQCSTISIACARLHRFRSARVRHPQSRAVRDSRVTGTVSSSARTGRGARARRGPHAFLARSNPDGPWQRRARSPSRFLRFVDRTGPGVCRAARAWVTASRTRWTLVYGATGGSHGSARRRGLVAGVTVVGVIPHSPPREVVPRADAPGTRRDVADASSAWDLADAFLSLRAASARWMSSSRR